jgi:hypothetical protein
MEELKFQVGDFLFFEDIDSDEEEKIIITAVDYENNIIRYKSEINFNEEISVSTSFMLDTLFYRNYKILEVDDYNGFYYAKLSAIENLQIGEFIIEINSLTKEDVFIIKKGSSTYLQMLHELENNSNEITILMNHFHIGYAVLNGSKIKGYIDT